MTRFSKILIANRGEIACRVMRSARALGYRTVAVYSEADRHMPHMALADQAVPIGPAPAAHSYLAIDKIIAAARRAGADAIHPGYGFLSENAAFADACAAADIAFIGPPVDAIRLMGNKAAAKRRMIPAGVPCVPGYDGEAQNDAVLMREAELIGFPIMVKATAGGGGKGMRLVAAMPQLAEALRAARSEALKAFGSDELILEKAILESRHVEIQVFGDTHGNVIHLFERDCSVQRRHQKVIEEAPSPVMTPALRYAMGAAAVAAAKTIGYVGAGTVEFLLAPDGKFYFLEMNTRLQVEHPVTEMVTGLDLVEWQLRVAAGDRLPLGQEQVAFRGHAIEVRLYAEDAHGDFLPQAGTLLAWEPPQGAGVRVDHGVASGVAISPYYDPMIAKIIAHGATREEARRRLVVALQDTLALGIETNRRFLIDCLSHPAFAAGETSTAFIERHFPPAERAPPAPPPRMLTLAAALMAEQGREAEAGSLSHWHSSGRAIAPLMLQSGEAEIALRVTAEGERRYHVEGGTPHPNPPRPGGREILHRADRPSPLDEEGWLGGSSGVDIELLHTDGTTVRFLCNGLAETGRFCWQDDTLHLSLDGATAVFEDVALARRGAGADAAAGAALAPMTGIISAVRVRAGDAVRKGQCLVILEAMKMEHEILAPRDGTVAAVLVAPGEQVMTRRLLVELVPAA